jgi:hypothetical protein
MASWPLPHRGVLETRTKESNVHASLTALCWMAKLMQKAPRAICVAPHCSPNCAYGPGLEFEHVMLGPEKRRAMLE